MVLVKAYLFLRCSHFFKSAVAFTLTAVRVVCVWVRGVLQQINCIPSFQNKLINVKLNNYGSLKSLQFFSRYIPFFVILLIYFSGCFSNMEDQKKIPLSGWLLLGPSSLYYWSVIALYYHAHTHHECPLNIVCCMDKNMLHLD